MHSKCIPIGFRVIGHTDIQLHAHNRADVRTICMQLVVNPDTMPA